VNRLLLVIAMAALGCSDTVSDIGFDLPPDAATPEAEVDAPPIEPVGLIINEVAAAGEPEDWFELYNGSTQAIELAGYAFSDDALEPLKATFAAGARIEAGGYFVQYLGDDVGFGLGAEEQLVVTHPDGLVVDQIAWLAGESPDQGSFARLPDVTGAFATVTAPSPGAANGDAPAVGQ